MSSPSLPEVGTIERGRVVRIEPYGAFVQLENFRLRGLVHISQLASYRVERVEDAVSLEESVWVKILDLEQQPSDDGRPPRWKMKLTLKDASQDGSRQDTSGQGASSDSVAQKITENLNSNIGIGVAIDPMAQMKSHTSSSGNIVLKSDRKPQRLINGYALVGDDEGEPEQPSRPPPQPVVPQTATVRAPLGRGRATALPAWMTRKEEPSGNVGLKDSDAGEQRRAKHKKRKKSHKRHRREVDEVDYSDDSANERKRRRKKRKHAKHDRKNRRDDDSFDDRERRRRTSRDDGSDDSWEGRKHRRSKRRKRPSKGQHDDGSSNSGTQGRNHSGDLYSGKSDDSDGGRRTNRKASDRSKRRNGSSSADENDRSCRQGRNRRDSDEDVDQRRSKTYLSGSSSDDEYRFTSLKEAKKLIASMERTREGRK